MCSGFRQTLTMADGGHQRREGRSARPAAKQVNEGARMQLRQRPKAAQRAIDLRLTQSAERFPRQMFGDVFRKPFPRSFLFGGGSGGNSRQTQPRFPKMFAALFEQSKRIGTPLRRSHCRLSPDEHRSFYRDYRKKFRHAKPQIPVIYPGNTVIEQTYLRQCRPSEDHATARNKIAYQEFPKYVALRTWGRIGLSPSAVRGFRNRLGVNERRLRGLRQNPHLLID